MTYSAGEALILTQIQATTNFNANNTSRGNWTILSSGKSKSYCIIFPGEAEREQHSLGLGGSPMKYLTTWQTVAQVWVHLKKYTNASLVLQERRQEIIDRIDAWPRLADSLGVVQDAFVRSLGEITEQSNKNAPVFYMQELNIEWKEESNVTLAE